ncbi:hypothetical protein BPA01_37240 [Brevibacillus parabrevis]|uniref:Uncharacterized protein n=1 Tax=Brevibacillus parabrevis TaxID=54914 RepID=A0A4Y3PLB8_BREPA|nr:hypothetical protein BPA01_37240 [Brevibacillus parabrevis]
MGTGASRERNESRTNTTVFDCFTFIAKTEQLEAFQLHKKQREDSGRKALGESCSMNEPEYGLSTVNQTTFLRASWRY